MNINLEGVAQDFAEAVEEVDTSASHERFQEGIGPFEEETQIEFILDHLQKDSSLYDNSSTGEKYPQSRKELDLKIGGNPDIFLEAKLLRFRGDNGRLSQYMFRKIFSPFRNNTFLNDAKRLAESEFRGTKALLGIYYEREDEPQEILNLDNLSKKLQQDAKFWYNLTLHEATRSSFSRLRHPVHEKGAIIILEISGD